VGVLAMIHIGIDPGLDGAVAYLGGESGAGVLDSPSLRVGTKRQHDPAGMVRLIRAYDGCELHATIEAQSARPGQGVTSMFSAGKGFGLWLGILAALNVPYTLVTPQRWKAAMLDGMARDKDASRLRATQLWPALAAQLALKKHHGRAEALLIAEHGRRVYSGKAEELREVEL